MAATGRRSARSSYAATVTILWRSCLTLGAVEGMTTASVATVLGIAASTIALIGFLPWALQQRRRPEIRVLWRIAMSGQEEDVVDWPPSETKEAAAGSEVVVEASVLNVGDATTARAQTNFVVPGSIMLTSLARDPRPARWSHNRVAGQAPGYGVYFVAAAFDLPPADWYLQRFRLRLPDNDADVRLLFELSDGRLNATGRRYVPSRSVGGELPDAPFGTPWPTPDAPSHWWRRGSWHQVSAEPPGRLLCRRGQRADVRDLRVVRWS